MSGFNIKWLLIYFFIWLPGLILAQSKAQLEKQRLQIIKDIENTSKQLESTEKTKKENIDELKILEGQVNSRKKLIDNLESEVKLNEALIQSNQERLGDLKQKHAILLNQYKHLLQASYLKKMANSKWSYLLSSTNLNNLMIRWQYIQQFDRYTDNKLQEIKRISDEIESKNLEITKVRENTLAVLDESAKHVALLQKEQKEKDALVKKLSKEEQSLRANLLKREKERERLNTAIEKIIIAELAKAKAKEKEQTSTSTGKKKEIDNSGFSNNKGALNWPISNGSIIGRFGTHPHPTIKNVEVSNNGVDFASPSASSVQCVYDGEVVGVTYIPGFKNMVIIKHGNYYTVYSKLDDVSIEKGNKIKGGQSIGRILPGEGGLAELHFELWNDKTKLNPEPWFNR